MARSNGTYSGAAASTEQALYQRIKRPHTYEPTGPLANPPAGKETCELIHSSVVQRYKWAKAGNFEPFPYHPKNAATLLDKPQGIIAELSAFEKTYLPEELL